MRNASYGKHRKTRESYRYLYFKLEMNDGTHIFSDRTVSGYLIPLINKKTRSLGAKPSARSDTTKEVARSLELSRTVMTRLLSRKTLPTQRLVRSWQILEENIMMIGSPCIGSHAVPLRSRVNSSQPFIYWCGCKISRRNESLFSIRSKMPTDSAQSLRKNGRKKSLAPNCDCKRA